MTTYVIMNGPSNHLMRGFDFGNNYVFGCNYAYRDWPLTHLVCADCRMVEAVNQETQHFFNRYTKHPKYRAWGWTVEPLPGADSGSYAVDLALNHTDEAVVVIGADGILGLESATVYNYTWRPKGPKAKVYPGFRAAVLRSIQDRTDRITFLTTATSDVGLPTKLYEEYLDEHETNVY